MAICILGDQHDIDRAKHHGVDAMSTEVSVITPS
jgi:large subunit ribosomal protein L10Ae